jgi:hypothetical protein
MIGKNEMGILADRDIIVDLHSVFFELFNFFQKRFRIDDNSIPDDTQLARMEYSGGNEVEDDLSLVDDNRVTGIVPPLIAGHGIKGRSQEVDYLPLALITPLGAEYEQISHKSPSNG